MGSRSIAEGVILSCVFVRVMFCCAGCAWACGAALLLGVAKAASSGFTIFYLRFVSSLLFLISRPRRQCNDRVRRRKTCTRVHSQM